MSEARSDTPLRLRGNMVKRKSRTAKSVQPLYPRTVSPAEQLERLLRAKGKA